MRAARSTTAVVAALALLALVLPAAASAAAPTDTTETVSTNAPSAAQAADACRPVANGSAPENPETDRLGWENGCWYDESLAVTRSDGLNDTELDAVVGRAMARVERVRQLEFDETVPVEVISRQQYRQTLANGSEPTTAARLHQNVKWEATFMINESTDALSVQESTLASGVLGFYSPTEERIVIVSENTTTPRMNEITLSQELFHALQDQRFNISGYNQSTTELHNARDGIIEGDGNFVDYRYSQRCAEEWACLRPEASPGGGNGSAPHAGVQLTMLVPYSEGPEFVQERYERAGWEAVNEVYETPPDSTEQVIHPEKYPDEVPRNVSIDSDPQGEWRVPSIEAGVDHASFGEGGLFTTFWYAAYEATGARGAPTTVGVPYASAFNFRPGTTQLSQLSPYNYSHPVTAGWDGDRLLPYVTNESSETNETGYVWKLAWDSPADADEFAEAYRELLSYRGADPVDGRANTYRVPTGTEFADAFHLSRDGDTVVLVNAPSVEELPEIRPSVEDDWAAATPTDTATESDGTGDAAATDDGSMTGDSSTTDEETDATGGGGEAATTAASGPGFGPVAALVALVVVTLRRRR